MSGSFFNTILTADARTAPDGKGVEWEKAGTGTPRGRGWRDWVTVHCLAEDALKIVAKAIETQPMLGLSGDHPQKRDDLKEIILTVAEATKGLALDADGDGYLSDPDWEKAMNKIKHLSQQATKDIRENRRRQRGKEDLQL